MLLTFYLTDRLTFSKPYLGYILYRVAICGMLILVKTCALVQVGSTFGPHAAACTSWRKGTYSTRTAARTRAASPGAAPAPTRRRRDAKQRYASETEDWFTSGVHIIILLLITHRSTIRGSLKWIRWASTRQQLARRGRRWRRCRCRWCRRRRPPPCCSRPGATSWCVDCSTPGSDRAPGASHRYRR